MLLEIGLAEALGKQGLLSFENPTILIGEGPFAQRDLKEFLAKYGLAEPQVTFIEEQDPPCVVFFNRVPSFIIGRSGWSESTLRSLISSRIYSDQYFLQKIPKFATSMVLPGMR